jgi:hydroxyethylthiazole kinase
MLGTCLENVRNTVPLVHNITNYVTVNDVANILLACGGSPIMSDEPEDVEDITSICGGLNINIGTLNQRSIEGMFRAGAKANALGHVVLLDPVGAGASALRTNTAVELMEKIKFTVIRGNISEIKTLALGSGTTKGVDADVADAVTDANLDSAVKFVKDFAAKSGAIVAVTGAIDLVSDGTACYVIRNGRPEMGKITGTGCQLSGMMTAFVVANPDNKLEAAGDGDDSAAFGRKVLDKFDGTVQICVGHGVRNVSVNALRRAAAQRQRLDLGDIAADDGEFDLLHQLDGGVRAQGRRARADGVEQHDMAEGICLCARAEHALDAALVQRADVDVQAAADRRDVLDVLRLIGHDRAAAAGKQNVGHVVDRDIVRDIVHQRHSVAHIFKTGTQHTKRSL